MACKAPHHQSKHHAHSGGGGSSFAHYHCLAGAFLRRRLSTVTVGLPSSPPVDLDEPLPSPKGWERCLDLQTGKIFYRRASMSRDNGKRPKLDLKLNLSLPARGDTSRRVEAEDESPKGGSSTSSLPSSCLSSCSNSPEAASMVLAACPRCLMYVMLSEEDPRCPKCKSAVLLDFLHGNTNTNTTTANNTNKTTNI